MESTNYSITEVVGHLTGLTDAYLVALEVNPIDTAMTAVYGGIMRKITVRCSLVLFVTLVACGEPDGSVNLEGTGYLEQAIETNACNTNMLTWQVANDSNNVCAGPWEYEQYAGCLQRPSTCPDNEKECVQWTQCQDWDFGCVKDSTGACILEQQPQQVAGTIPLWCCCIANSRICRNAPISCPSTCTCRGATTWCNSQANDAVATKKQEIPPEHQPLVRWTSPTRQETQGSTTCGLVCKFILEYPVPASGNCDCQVSLCKHREVWDERCGNTGTRILSNAELRLQGIRDNDSKAALTCAEPACLDVPAWKPPRCTTCESVVNPQEKFDCLSVSRSAYPNNINLQTLLIERQKLTFEFYGHLLREEQRAVARNLYFSNPEITSTCGEPADPGVGDQCRPMGVAGGLNARLGMCKRLLSSHVPKAVREQEDSACLDVLQQAGSVPLDDGTTLPSGTCREAYVTSSISVAQELLNKRLDGLRNDLAASTNEAQDVIAAQKMLQFLDTWYQRFATVRTESSLDDSLVAALQRFWQSVEAGKNLRLGFKQAVASCSGYSDLSTCPSRVAVESNVAAALNNTIGAGMAIDQAILKAAFGTRDGRPVLTGIPLLAVTGAILQPLASRLEAQLPMHDLGCLFKGCKSPDLPPMATPVSQMWQLLSRLDDNAALAQTLSTNVGLLGGWKASVEAILAQHVRLAQALDLVVGGSYQPGAFMDMEEERVPASTWRFFEILRAGRTRSLGYAATGLFTMASGRRLLTGTNWEKRNAVKDYVRQKKSELELEKSRFDGELAQAVQDLLNETANESSIARLHLRRDHLLDELEDLETKRDAHVAAHDVGDILTELIRNFVDMAGYFENMQEFTVIGATAPIYLSAADAVHDGITPATIGDVTSRPPILVTSGQILAIHTSGQWAPTCALRERHVLTPNGNATVPINVTNVTTGPEGYNITWDGTTYIAETKSSSSSHSVDLGTSNEVCYGTAGLAQSIWGLSARGCIHNNYNFDMTWGNQKNKGVDSRTSAAFSSGVYLKNTPFWAPAGSLLVLEMPPGSTPSTPLSSLRDIHLVRAPSASIPVRYQPNWYLQGADFYLVVNDLGTCADADSNNELMITTQTLTGYEEVAKQLVGRMAVVLNTVRAKETALVARGEVLPSEIRAIEAEARKTALADMPVSVGATAIPVSEYPPPVRDVFEAFLARELTRLERAVRLANIDEEHKRLLHEISTIQSDLAYATRQGALLGLWPAWSVRNVDLDHFYGESRRLAGVLVDFVYPFLDLWYPGVLASLTMDSNATALVKQAPGASLKELAINVIGLADTVANVIPIVDIQNANSTIAIKHVVLSFRRPDNPAGGAGGTYGGASTYGADGWSYGLDPRYTTYRAVDPARARALWEAIEGNKRGEIKIVPEDIYVRDGGTAVLSCTRELPVLRQMGIAVVRPFGSDAPGAHPQSTTLQDSTLLDVFGDAGRDQPYASLDGFVEYELENDKWRSIDVPLVYSDTTNPVTLVDYAIYSRAGTTQDTLGISPFGTFHLPFPTNVVSQADLDDSWGQAATELVVVLELETVSGGTSLPWVPGCQ